MAQVINDPYARGTGAEAGAQLGNTLGMALNLLTQDKVKEFGLRRGIQSLRSLGVPQEEARILAQMQPKDQWAALQNEGKVGSKQQGSLLQGQLGPKELAAQARIEQLNAPYNKQLEAESTLAQIMYDELSNMKELVNTGNVASGLFWGAVPDRLQNEETQRFIASANTIAGLLAAQGGRATEFKIKFAQLQKPSTWQKKGTQLKLIDKLLKDAQQPLIKKAIRDKLIDASGGYQPRNLSSVVNKYYNQYKDNPQAIGLEQFGIQKQQNSFDDINSIPMGAKFRDNQSGSILQKTPQGIIRVQ